MSALNSVLGALALLISALSPIILALIYRRQEVIMTNAKEASTQAADRAETVRRDLVNTAANTDEKLEHIKTSVNSERTAMIERLEAMHAEILLLRATPDADKSSVPAAVQNIHAPEKP